MNSNPNPTHEGSRPRKSRRKQLAIATLACISVPATLLAATVTGDGLSVYVSGYSNSVASAAGNGAIGSDNVISSGTYGSVAIGLLNEINSSCSVSLAVGFTNEVYALGGIALGINNHTTSQYAAAIGQGLISDRQGCLVAGRYNDPSAYSTETFVVGVGTSAEDKKNGLVVLNNGDVIIPQQQGDISMGIYGD